MERFYYPAKVLPDIEMYAGDTTPWLIFLLDEHRHKVPYEDVMCTICRLSLTPVKLTTSLGYQAPPSQPELEIISLVEQYDDGSAVVPIFFDMEDTIRMRGRYIYELDCFAGEEKRLCQGVLIIKQDINRR